MQILPDGRVQIRNKQSGETKVITPQELGSYGVPYSSYVSEKEAYDKIQTSPTTGQTQIAPTLSETEKKSVKEAGGAMNMINELEKVFVEAGGGQMGTGLEARVRGVKTSVKGSLGFSDKAKTYNDARQGFATALKKVVGEAGMLTNQDYERMARLIPKLTSTPGEALDKFKMLRSQISSMYGQETIPTTLEGKIQPQQANLPKELINLLLAPQKKYLTETVPKYYEKGMPETYGGQLKAQAEIAPKALGVVTDLAAKASLARGGVSATKGLVNLIKGGGPKATIGRARDIAAKQASQNLASGSKIAEAGEKYVANDPFAAKFAEKVGSQIKDTALTPEQLLEKLGIWNKAYTAAGRVGSSSKAGYYNALARAAKQEMKVVAPEVAKLTGQLNFLYKAPKAARKALFTLATTAGGYAGLKWILSGGNKK